MYDPNVTPCYCHVMHEAHYHVDDTTCVPWPELVNSFRRFQEKALEDNPESPPPNNFFGFVQSKAAVLQHADNRMIKARKKRGPG